MVKINRDDVDIQLVLAYRNLASVWSNKADACMARSDAWGTYNAVKESIACESKARKLQQANARLIDALDFQSEC